MLVRSFVTDYLMGLCCSSEAADKPQAPDADLLDDNHSEGPHDARADPKRQTWTHGKYGAPPDFVMPQRRPQAAEQGQYLRKPTLQPCDRFRRQRKSHPS